MAHMTNTKYGWQWSCYIQADAECDRYWKLKKQAAKHRPEDAKKSPSTAMQGDIKVN